MSVDDRQKWVSEFEASDRGKEFLSDRQKRIQSAARFELQIEDNGNFVVYDVPAGVYGLRGRIEKVVSEKNYVFEVFGQIEVSNDVDEVLLDPIAVSVTRLLKPGEPVPQFEIPTFDNKAKIDNSLIAGKTMLISFWSLKSLPSTEFAAQIQKAYQEVQAKQPLQLLSVCIDSDPKQALEFVKSKSILGWHGIAKHWEHKMVNEFGVRAIPALFLVDNKGYLRLTHAGFQTAFQQDPSASLSQTIVTALATVEAPAGPPPEGTRTDSSNDRQP
jgi:peroxiredoxin